MINRSRPWEKKAVISGASVKPIFFSPTYPIIRACAEQIIGRPRFSRSEGQS